MGFRLLLVQRIFTRIMANLKELRNRITSISSTMQITSAMKMVSAAKLKKAQDAITQMRPYSAKLEEILVNVSATLDTSEQVYARQPEETRKVLLVMVSSNRGLCGAFNANIVKKVQAFNKDFKGQVDVYSVGKKAHEILGKRLPDLDRIEQQGGIFDALTFSGVAEIAEDLMERFRSGQYDKIQLVYNQFQNAAVQHVQLEPFLPIRPPQNLDQAAGDYIYEPHKEDMLEELIPKSLKTQLFKAILDSNASEHGARMTAMHQATDNAQNLKRDLSLEYNKARQAAITNEILEIVSGADALSG
jgi:F-type H+-transporting ATPase subunit gamma